MTDSWVEVIPEAVLGYEILIPGEPVAQGRGRAVRVGEGVRVVDPKRSRGWKAYARLVVTEQVTGPPLDGPVILDVEAVFARPKGTYRKRDPRGREPKVTKPDVDNVVKAVKDALSGIAYLDDRQVMCMTAEKWVGAQGEAPYVKVWVRRWSEGT